MIGQVTWYVKKIFIICFGNNIKIRKAPPLRLWVQWMNRQEIEVRDRERDRLLGV